MKLWLDSVYRISRDEQQKILDSVLSDENKNLQSENGKLNAENAELRKQLSENQDIPQQPEKIQPEPAVKPEKKADLSKAGKKEVKEVREITDSWSEIFASIDDGTYREKYKIGNYKPISLLDEGIVEMQIAAFDADVIAHSSDRAAITWLGRFEMKNNYYMNHPLRRDLKKKGYIVGTGGVGGWRCSDMRLYLHKTIKPLIQSSIADRIKKVKKYSYSYGADDTFIKNEETVDTVWIPSLNEIFGDFTPEKLAPYYFTMFPDKKERRKVHEWWLRSAYSETSFDCVTAEGNFTSQKAHIKLGVILGFCT